MQAYTVLRKSIISPENLTTRAVSPARGTHRLLFLPGLHRVFVLLELIAPVGVDLLVLLHRRGGVSVSTPNYRVG